MKKLMQAIAGLNKPGIAHGQVIFGGLTEAKVNTSLPAAPESSIYTAFLNESGIFSANLSTLDPDEYVVISVSDGAFAKNNEGLITNSPIPFTGKIHGLI